MKSYYFILSTIMFITYGCKDAEIKPKSYPLIITKEVTEITTSGVTLEAEIVVKGTDEITDFGFIISDGTDSVKKSVFKSNIFKTRISTDLKPEIAYTCKAYITTSQNLVYGNTVNFVSLGSTSPVIISFSPNIGYDGDTVTLIGKYLSYFPENNKVYVNNIPAQIIQTTYKSIVFRTPSQPFVGDANISLEVNGVKITSSRKITILGPQISSVSTLSEYSGRIVSITGTNLTSNGTNISINFGSYNAEILNSTNNQIDVVVPAPTLSLLTNTYVGIKLTNGSKVLLYSQYFSIKQSWETKSPPLTFSRSTDYQAGFTYNGKGYMHDVNYGYLYEYNPQTNNWKQFGSATLTSNSNSLYIQLKDQVFRVGGIDYLYKPLNYLWAYNFLTEKWTEKNHLPFSFSSASYFVLDNLIYILTFEGQLWQCDFEKEQYTRLNDFPEKNIGLLLSTFIANGNAYAVQYGKTWLYNKQNDTWISKTSNPFYKSNYSVSAKCFSYNNTGYILNNGMDLYKYDYVNDRWILTSRYPNAWGSYAEKSIFIINNKAYIAATSASYIDGAPLMYLYLE